MALPRRIALCFSSSEGGGFYKAVEHGSHSATTRLTDGRESDAMGG